MVSDIKSTRNAVVTGTAGIALAVARRLVSDGFFVILCGNDPEQNAAARSSLGDQHAQVVELDVSDADAVERFAADLGHRLDGLDALVNCAAIQPYGTIETTTPANWQKVVGINLTGYYLMSHFLYPLLKSRGNTSVVNFASVQGHLNQNNVLGYATTKGAIHAFTRAMAVDCAKDGVRVNSVSPGSIRTPLLEFAARSLTPEGGNLEDTIKEFGKSHSIGRVGTTEEVAALVSYLVGPESGFCIGGDFPIDGGLRAKLNV
ncbi:SDR family NAD(P)-dependent oxidoreductase [Devosia sp.]|jgi:NAD(P)-dependent dehydrogenase (short-subunit alcohol dehydrogenase family)|uniref:SDR family NAD(P)-dependent oxidoreductase n=1 Tax=Devosia sp. TaxID=1871048 RepID=UPI0037C04A64